jgi:hypothetical protein
MARVTLQVMNVASLILAAGASVALSFASRRFDNPAKRWIPSAAIGCFFLLCQLGLIFIESKEEEELSLVRTQRLPRTRQAILVREKATERILWDRCRKLRFGRGLAGFQGEAQ